MTPSRREIPVGFVISVCYAHGITNGVIPVIKRLQATGFKSIEHLDVNLAPLVVIFGPNTAGKSNLLEAMLLLSRTVTERTLADAFSTLRGHPQEAFTLPHAGLSELLSRETAELSLGADIEPKLFSDANHSTKKRVDPLRYKTGIRIRPATGELEVTDEYLARLNRQGKAKHAPRIEKQNQQLILRRRSRPGHPQQVDLGLNHTIASNLQLSGNEYLEFDSLRTEMLAWNNYYLDPRVAMREARPPSEVTDIGPHGESIAPFLYRLKQSDKYHRKFHEVTRALRAAIPTISELDVDLDRKRGTLDIQICQEGTTYSSRVISEGTLRVMALCAIAANPWPNRLVAFEEPENGVHPRRIEVIADLLHGITQRDDRQVVVTTHSPTFVSAMLRKHQENPENIKLLVCARSGRETLVDPFQPGPLFADDATHASLASEEDPDKVGNLMLRGWLDG